MATGKCEAGGFFWLSMDDGKLPDGSIDLKTHRASILLK